MSLKTNFSSPCLEAGPKIRYESFHTDDSRFMEWTPRYIQVVCLVPEIESHYIFSEVNPLNTDTPLIRTFLWPFQSTY